MAKKRTFSYGTNAGNPERAKWAHLGRPGSQSERTIRFIFSTRRLAQINFHQRQVISIYCTNSTFSPLSCGGGYGGREFEVGPVATESDKQMQIGQVLPLIFIPYTYLGSKKKPLAFILAFKKSVIFLKSGRKSCSEKLLQLRLLK